MHVRNTGRWLAPVGAVIVLAVVAAGCARKQPPIARPSAPADAGASSTSRPLPPPPPPPPPAPETPSPVPAEPMVTEADLSSRSLDDLNRESPFKPVFFAFDSSEVSQDGQAALASNAELLKRYASWVVTVEGHCDERGTAEYNLALGERRALAAKSYLVSLGIGADRLRTVSYGKEFPFDPGRTEEAFARNRRAHFVVTSK